MTHLQEMAFVPAAGVHLSYFSSPDAISLKIQSIAKDQFNLPQFTDIDKIKERIRENRDLYDRGNGLTLVSPQDDPLLSSFLPEARAALLALSQKLRQLQGDNSTLG